MKMLEDLAEVVRLINASKKQPFALGNKAHIAAYDMLSTHAAEIQRNARDARRYRWLREADFTTDGILEIMWDTRDHEHLTCEALDQAIDAAMQETGR